MKYIDADRLRAELERLHKAHSGKYGCDEVGLNLEYLEDFIDSLQQEQPEVDLEKEMQKFGERWPYPASFDGYDKEWVDELTEECAKHFYELGLNARKED